MSVSLLFLFTLPFLMSPAVRIYAGRRCVSRIPGVHDIVGSGGSGAGGVILSLFYFHLFLLDLIRPGFCLLCPAMAFKIRIFRGKFF